MGTVALMSCLPEILSLALQISVVLYIDMNRIEQVRVETS